MTQLAATGPARETGGPALGTAGPVRETAGPARETGGPARETGGPARPTTDPVTSVAEGRDVVDALDADIRRLVLARRDVSRRIQALRRLEGRPGIQHSRENEVMAGYAAELSRPGVELALLVLRICRGEPGQLPMR